VPPFSRFSRRGLSDCQSHGLLRGRRTNLHLQNFPVVEFDRTSLAKEVVAKTAPAPEFRTRDQTPLHRIAMHIAKFLDALVFGPDVEIVKSFLPDVLRRVIDQTKLRRSSGLRENAPRKAQFERLHHRRWILFFWFTDEQVNVLGHDHVSHNDEPIALAHLFEHGEKQVATFLCVKQRTALITTAGDEVQVSGSIKTFGLAVHSNKVEARKSRRSDRTHRSPVMKVDSRDSPLLEKREKVGTPGVLFQI
jgi:hypothetical protein